MILTVIFSFASFSFFLFLTCFLLFFLYFSSFFLSLFWVARNPFFFGLNCFKISCNISFQKIIVLSRLAGYLFGPSFPFFLVYIFWFIFLLFSHLFIFLFLFFIFSRKKFLLLFFLVFLSKMFYCWL